MSAAEANAEGNLNPDQGDYRKSELLGQLDEGISGRCDGCRSFRDNGKNPVCADACVMRAIEWGDIDELRAAHPEGVSELPILPSAKTTGPSLVVDPYDAALNEDYEPFVI